MSWIEPVPGPEGEPERETDRYPVADAAGYLSGRWSIERTVYDLRGGVQGSFRGTAGFRPDAAEDGAGEAGSVADGSVGDGPVEDGSVADRSVADRPGDAAAGAALLHVEEGELMWGGAAPQPASRTLRLRPRPDGTAEVDFADGRYFHDLDLRSGRWTTVHPCAADRYEGTFTAVAADEWHLEWRVAGPAKDQLLRSVYRRQR